MANIIGIPTTRVSDQFVQQRVLQQVQYDLRELFRLESQLSTGRKFELPGEEPVAALRVLGLQRLLEQKKQVRGNLETTQSYLTATDAVLSQVSAQVAEIRGVAIHMMNDATVDDDQRTAAVQQVQEAVKQLVDTGNQKFRGRHLFAGSETSAAPFRFSGASAVEYLGDDGQLLSYCDVDMLFAGNVTGNDVFGAISESVRGAVDLGPVLHFNTRLADLRGGDGITSGSIAVSDGSHTSIIDISTAETIGDVAALIRANPPETRSLDVEITATGLVIQLDSAAGDLSIREVGGGTTASELGILTETGVGNDPVIGDDLDPILRTTTRLDDILGSRAHAVVRFSGPDNDLILEADVRGETDAEGNWLNGVEIRFENDATAGSEWVVYTASQDPAVPPTIVVHIEEGMTQARHVVSAINDAYDAGDLPFTAQLDPLDEQRGGVAYVTETPPGETAAVTAGGSGGEIDLDSGLQIAGGGNTYTISLASAETVEDVLNRLNSSDASVLAEINATATGINVRSRLSGVDFAIGENGGTTATQLGLRTFTADIRLEDLNYGAGASISDDGDFTIQLTDGTELEIDLDIETHQTIGDVLNLINDAAAAAGASLEARLARYGNGIELVDESTGVQSLTVTREFGSMAAIDLGLVPEGQNASDSPTPGAQATAVWDDGSGADNELVITANVESWDYNGVTLNVHDDGGSVGHVPILTYDPVNKVLDVQIENGVTTAADVIAELGNTPDVAGLFTIANAASSLGTGTLTDADPAWQSVSLSGGQPETLTGADPYPLETEGLFTALLRLQQALEANDLWGIQRAVELLDAGVLDMNLARARVATSQQGLDVLELRLDSEEVELREALSLEYDVDFVEVVSNLSARQLALEAAYKSIGEIFRITLLDYL